MLSRSDIGLRKNVLVVRLVIIYDDLMEWEC